MFICRPPLVCPPPSDFLQLFDSYQTFQEPQTSNSGKSSVRLCFLKYADVNAAAGESVSASQELPGGKPADPFRRRSVLQGFVCRMSFSL